MVRLYLENENDDEKNKKKYVDIYFWSIVKAYIIGWLGVVLILFGVSLVLIILSYIFNLF